MLSIVLTVKFKKRVQGIGLAIGRVNAQLLLSDWPRRLLSDRHGGEKNK
jgi:hypothetical protein